MAKLNNGAEILEERRISDDERIVLARWDRGDGLPEYVTWSVSNGGDAFSGDYHDSIVTASAAYAKRARLVVVA